MKISAVVVIFCSLILSLEADAYVQNRSRYGKKMLWSDGDRTLTIVINPTNNDSMDKDKVEDVIEYSVDEWNSSHADISLNIDRVDSSEEEEDVNNLYFTTESIFGSGVLAITSVLHGELTGRILEADILINDKVVYSVETDAWFESISSGPGSDQKHFLGDVLSHELGHFYGLSHGQVNGSSMIYISFTGQYSLHSDDIEGLNAIYKSSTGDATRGTLEGTVAGSDEIVGVFGAYVHAIASSTGKVQAAAITDSKGRFSLSSLPVDESYFLYIDPIQRQASVPNYFSSVRTNFCSGGRSWQGFYFQKCGAGENGLPQGFFVADEEAIDVGTISVQCGFPSPVGKSFNIVHGISGVGDAITGFFTDADIDGNIPIVEEEEPALPGTSILNDASSRKSKTYSIDLTDYAPEADEADLYLEIKIVAQAVYSPLRMNVIVSRTGETAQMFPATWEDAALPRLSETGYDGQSYSTLMDFDHSGENLIRFPLDETDTSNNEFTIELVPRPLSVNSQLVTKAQIDKNKDTISFYEQLAFPSKEKLASSNNHYLMVLSLSNKSGSSYAPVKGRSYAPYDDNSSCMQAQSTYRIRGHVALQGSGAESSEESNVSKPTLCGSVDSGGSGPSSGMGNFVFIFLASLLMAAAQRRRERQKTCP